MNITSKDIKNIHGRLYLTSSVAIMPDGTQQKQDDYVVKYQVNYGRRKNKEDIVVAVKNSSGGFINNPHLRAIGLSEEQIEELRHIIGFSE